jgi:hypothetical protein
MPSNPSQPNGMLVCPWLELRGPLVFGDIELLPASVAIDQYPSLAPGIRTETSTYSTGYRHPRTLEELEVHQRGEDVVFDIEWVEPSVIMLHEQVDVERARTALDALCFASLASNDGSVFYANAEVFRSEVVPLRFDGLRATVHRRMSGSLIDGATAGVQFETRPRWCGQFVHGEAELAEALAAVVFEPEAEPLRDAFSALRLASKDAADVPVDVERSFFAMVVTHLMDRGAASDTMQAHEEYALRLLGPLVSDGAPQILAVMKAVRHVRNGMWHPKPRTADLMPLERQRLVPFNLLAFRMVEALVVASLVDMGALAPGSKHALKVSAIEEWIAATNTLADQPDEERKDATSRMERNDRAKAACSIGSIWSHRVIAVGIRRAVEAT